jgi:putative NADH-flavin reductase
MTDVENAVDGVDAVFVCLGHREDSPADLIQSTVKNVLDAMKKLKVHRLIVLAHAAINDYGDKNTISRKLLKTMKGASDKAVLADLEKTSGLLETEGGTIDWIVVRPPKLTSDPIEAKGKYKTGKLDLGPTDKISRADVAHFLLSCVTDDTFIRKRPMVSY